MRFTSGILFLRKENYIRHSAISQCGHMEKRMNLFVITQLSSCCDLHLRHCACCDLHLCHCAVVKSSCLTAVQKKKVQPLQRMEQCPGGQKLVKILSFDKPSATRTLVISSLICLCPHKITPTDGGFTVFFILENTFWT